MRTVFLVLLVMTIVAEPGSGRPADQTLPGSRLALLYDSLSNPIPDREMAAEISDILLIRGGQEILLAKGVFRLFKPVAGKVFGAVFTGEGRFTLYPPTDSEREEFGRQTKLTLTDGRYEWAFTRAVFWFQDTLLGELGGGLRYAAREVSREEDDIVRRSRLYATEKTNQNRIYDLITELEEPSPRPFLFAHFAMPDKKEVFLEFNPRRFEEVAFYRPPFEGITGSVWWLEMVNSFHALEEYASAGEYALSGEKKDRFDWISNTIGLAARKSGDVDAHATVVLRATGPGSRLLDFLLDPVLVLDSVTLPGGARAGFHRADEAWSGAVLLPPSDSGEWTIRFHYHGEYLRPRGLRRASGTLFVPRSSGTTGWYPAPGGMDRMSFDVTFTVPDDLTVVAPGRLVSDSAAAGLRTSRYATKAPDLICSFSLGHFEKQAVQLSDTEVTVTVYDLGTGESERIGRDCANSFRLYTHLFGPPPFAELRVTGGPMTHGQAFQEFIHLPWFEEFVGEKKSAIALGRAHEVAHAWWGHAVGWASYHDQWISEAFAEYSALLYAPFVLKQDEEFFEKLRDWRDRVAGARKYSLGSGARLGSVWLGYRTSTSQTRGDYSLSTYVKGAWVIHMLRMMMIDLTTRNEDGFLAMMRDFYGRYAGKDPTTQDFIELVSRHFGSDMKWFFDQWIYGTEIPVLRCGRTIARTPEGKYSVTLSVAQEGVSKPFLLYLPFELRYGNGTAARARLKIDRAKQEFNYILDQEPVEVRFNILESLLCPVEE